MPRWLRGLAREPLVHFALIGVALFAVDRALRDGESEPARVPPTAENAAVDRRIVVDDALRDELRQGFATAEGRAPTAAELDDAVRRWIEDEVLYREAVARGLDRGDPAVRQRLARKMGFVIEQEIEVPRPSEAELEAWFADHRDRWAAPARIDFTHVFVAGHGDGADTRAAELRDALVAGANPALIGDRFSGGRVYRGRKPADLAAAFGDEFAAGVAGQPLGAWVVHSSRHGLHVVRVDRREAAHDADYAAARLDVLQSWTDARRAEGYARRFAELRAAWEVVER